jgi:hypothetical protein
LKAAAIDPSIEKIISNNHPFHCPEFAFGEMIKYDIVYFDKDGTRFSLLPLPDFMHWSTFVAERKGFTYNY